MQYCVMFLLRKAWIPIRTSNKESLNAIQPSQKVRYNQIVITGFIVI